MKKRVALLFGGNSTEHDISIKSAQSIFKNMDFDIFKVIPIYINHNHEFFIAPECKVALIEKIENIIPYLKSFDIVFPIIHGNYGEDGKVQGLLDFFEIPYVGSKVLGSAIGMDKVLSKQLWKAHELPIVPYVVLYEKYRIKDVEKLGYPMIVKPANGGSSIGINKVGNRRELKKAIKIARQYDQKILIEKFLHARELECAIFQDKQLYASDIGEIFPANEFYDYNAKYENASRTTVSADIDVLVKRKIQDYAKQAFQIVGAKQYARVDFFYDGENVYINEINTIPGFTNISMYPELMKAQYSYRELITKLLNG